MNIGIPKRIRIISISEPSGKDGSFSRQKPKPKPSVSDRLHCVNGADAKPLGCRPMN
jgi:hypothetical protein